MGIMWARQTAGVHGRRSWRRKPVRDPREICRWIDDSVPSRNPRKEATKRYTDGFRAYEPLNETDAFDREYLVHGDGEYADKDVHVNTYESHGHRSEPWLSPHRDISKDKFTRYLRAFQLRRKLLQKSRREALKDLIKATL